jgi:hypothetical protein
MLVEKIPQSTSTIFGMHSGDVTASDSQWIIHLGLRPDGALEFTSNRETIVFPKAILPRSRWVHVTIVHYPHRATNPSFRMLPSYAKRSFLDVLHILQEYSLMDSGAKQPTGYTPGRNQSLGRQHMSWGTRAKMQALAGVSHQHTLSHSHYVS